MLRYTTFQYNIDTIVSKICAPAVLERFWHLPFDTKKEKKKEKEKLTTL